MKIYTPFNGFAVTTVKNMFFANSGRLSIQCQYTFLEELADIMNDKYFLRHFAVVVVVQPKEERLLP